VGLLGILPGERIASRPAAEPAASVPAVAPAPTPSAAAPGAATGEPTTLADLSAEERRQLPPLKISMHFWAPTPTERFAIVDGSRVGEGDRIGNAVVDAITADAVVLGWNGRRVHLPIR
ncbi:general secretion pathway protein GspB, partial [Lysobacter sp. D1-1-M9]|uniref:general secretion pathway protein GspB n=2 Tax=Novilysobacter longmucuonensis TaxID=3098603 RepID=UPI003983D881